MVTLEGAVYIGVSASGQYQKDKGKTIKPKAPYAWQIDFLNFLDTNRKRSRAAACRGWRGSVAVRDFI